MAKRLRFHPRVADDIAEAIAWYEGRSAGLGERFRSAVDVRFDEIADAAEIYPLASLTLTFASHAYRNFPTWSYTASGAKQFSSSEYSIQQATQRYGVVVPVPRDIPSLVTAGSLPMRTIFAADRSFVPAGHEDPRSPGVWKKMLLDRADLQPGTVRMINWARLPVGKSFAAHYHEDMQEVFIILDGVAQAKVGAEMVTLRRGDTIVIDPREVHQMWNRGDEDVEYVALGICGSAHGRTVVVPAEL
jgi:mannose-6-phosphate isomerase-like protein (cupin superfamily)